MTNPSYENLMTADIGRMYWAATKALPDQADLISAVAKSLAMGLDTLNVQAALAGDSPALTGALSIGGDVHAVLRSAVISLNNAAQAVLATAADYARTDDEAREDLHRLGLRLPSVADPSPASAGPALPDLAAPGATTDIDILGIHIEDVKVGTTPDPTDVGYEQGQQMDGPDLPATPTPGAH